MSDSQMADSIEWKLEEEEWMDFSPDELREFLAADLVGVEVDPEFRESLRNKLWRFVRSRYGRDGDGDD